MHVLAIQFHSPLDHELLVLFLMNVKLCKVGSHIFQNLLECLNIVDIGLNAPKLFGERVDVSLACWDVTWSVPALT